MTDEPAIGTSGRAILRQIRLCGMGCVAGEIEDRPGLLRLVALGHVRRFGPAHSLLSLTAKGEKHLDSLMRSE
jgi:hypothetical protein